MGAGVAKAHVQANDRCEGALYSILVVLFSHKRGDQVHCDFGSYKDFINAIAISFVIGKDGGGSDGNRSYLPH